MKRWENRERRKEGQKGQKKVREKVRDGERKEGKRDEGMMVMWRNNMRACLGLS